MDTIYQQPTNGIQGPIEEGSTNFSAASPEHRSASPDHKRGHGTKLMSPEKYEEVKLEELRAKLMALPESPKGATTGYNLFIQRHCESEPMKVKDMWKALPDTERQQFTTEADLSQLRTAEYDQWVAALGYRSISKINRDRLRSGKKKLRIPASVRPARKSSGFRIFFKAKVASGEVSTSKGRAAARKRTGELWRQLTPSQKAGYHDQWVIDCEQRLAASSQA
ncbi:hypothetical protein BKA62DRAFT_771185 [Auriculariales sp. MPI-PUGE-AT-0066]|nr:hypothetical protein BKA62DRAFT_771185 [Auriculariales sp. MPI-PUGE-AT-0066]